MDKIENNIATIDASPSFYRIPEDSPLRWLPMFYLLPQKLLMRQPSYLDTPRSLYKLQFSPKHIDLINEDAFLQLVWDSYSETAWKHLRIPHRNGTYHPIPGKRNNYSGEFPIWRMSYMIVKLIRKELEKMGWGMKYLFGMGHYDEFVWTDYETFDRIIFDLTNLIIEEQNWQPIIDAVWNSRVPEDYDGKSGAYRDFMRSWTHCRTAQHISLEELKEGILIGEDELYDIPDPDIEFEMRVMDKMKVEDFKKRLSERDMRILELRMEGYKQNEIADIVGFSNNSAVSKRINKIARQYEDFVEKEYGEFLDRHMKQKK